jgi:hypothetical protein
MIYVDDPILHSLLKRINCYEMVALCDNIIFFHNYANNIYDLVAAVLKYCHSLIAETIYYSRLDNSDLWISQYANTMFKNAISRPDDNPTILNLLKPHIQHLHLLQKENLVRNINPSNVRIFAYLYEIQFVPDFNQILNENFCITRTKLVSSLIRSGYNADSINWFTILTLMTSKQSKLFKQRIKEIFKLYHEGFIQLDKSMDGLFVFSCMESNNYLIKYFLKYYHPCKELIESVKHFINPDILQKYAY